MALINYATREINAKVVYYGPGLCGKTTNIEQVYARIKDTGKGKLVTLPTQTDRTLFFDFLPMELGTLKNFRVRRHLYTVPGQVFYNSTRKMVLKGADGVVFVVDSQREMADENLQSLNNLDENLSETGMRVGDLPMVMQYNKRDLPDCASIEDLDNSLNMNRFPSFEAVAKEGEGVMETLTGIVKLVLMDMKDRPDAHNLDMTALDRGGADRVRVIRGEFTSTAPEEEDYGFEEVRAGEFEGEEEIEDIGYAEALEAVEVLEEVEPAHEADLLEPETIEAVEEAPVEIPIEAVEDAPVEIPEEAVEEAPVEILEEAVEEVVLEPEEHLESDELMVSEEIDEHEDMFETELDVSFLPEDEGVKQEPSGGLGDFWSGSGTYYEEAENWGEKPGTEETQQEESDAVANIDFGAMGEHGSVDFDELTKEIATAQVESAGDEGLLAAMISETIERSLEDSAEFSADDIEVFDDIVSVVHAEAPEHVEPAREEPETVYEMERIPPHTVVVPAHKTSSDSFRIHQSFTLPVRIASSVGQREVFLKFDLSVELQGEGVGEEIGIQILPPRPEIAEGHPPPETAHGYPEEEAEDAPGRDKSQASR